MPPLDPLQIAAYAAGGVILIGAVSGGIVTIITAVKTLAKIEVSVNSEKTAALGREALLQMQVKMLQDQNAEKKTTASLLAQSTAQAAPVAVTAEPATPLPVSVVNAPDAPVPVKPA